MSNRDTHHSGNSKGLEAPSQEPETKTRQILYCTTLKERKSQSVESLWGSIFRSLYSIWSNRKWYFMSTSLPGKKTWPFLLDSRTLAWMKFSPLRAGCEENPMEFWSLPQKVQLPCAALKFTASIHQSSHFKMPSKRRMIQKCSRSSFSMESPRPSRLQQRATHAPFTVRAAP